MSYIYLLLGYFLVSPAFCVSKPKVTTPYGPIVGFEHKSTVTGSKYHVFLGIRYGNPPDHIYRFQKPEPVEKWPHINHDATHFRASCIPSLRSELEEQVNYSEDCLFLNIVTPPDAKEKKLPVLVFIHGGGFQFGDTSMIGYQKAADNFVSKDIIFVSIQYRLGPLGFFTTGDSEIPGNMGLWDQTLALQFLHEVLPDFGGDPDRITLAGHSAGAASVSALLYSPHSDHLFSQAIQLSGSIFSESNLDRNVVDDSRKLAKAAGCPQEDSKELRDCIEIRTVDELLDAMESIGELLPGPRTKKFHPYFDKDFFPYDIEKMSRKAPKKRTMQGLVSLESGLSVLYPVKLAKLLGVPKESWSTYSKDNLVDFIRSQVAVEQEFGTASARFSGLVEEFYLSGPMTGNSSFYLNAFANLLSDLQYNIPTLHEVELKLQHGWDTYLYIIDYDSETTKDPTHPIKGPFHASELRYLFNFNGMDTIPFNDKDKKFENYFVNAIVNFINTGTPSTKALLWPAVSKSQPFANLLLNDKPSVQTSFRQEAYELWQSDIAKTVGADLMKKRLPASKATFRHSEL
ncbi:Carboxylic ester hydrolase [Caenorhabditis elegans]|uniref:Carboxylic ester hydrolase n=1 Tax=Caenorhabditis elegans TaxID=6239 RepID=Q21266_CAEEL|nr:Carboxylic ester hydrolase [Caenorhabditis elegans]CCD64759.1 Carboxylic ester hydrolase [Caenorhabditis elegans]|eukprot:NP_505114.1 Carboxylic ester hydrolase [Caenorhabditis elegans]